MNPRCHTPAWRSRVVVAGAGCAGLATAYALDRALPRGWRITVVDPRLDAPAPKTWCFWGAPPPGARPLISKTWRRARIGFPGWSRVDPLRVNAYHMVEGAAYHQRLRDVLRQSPRVELLHGAVEHVEHGVERQGEGAVLQVDGRALAARWVFQSCRVPRETRPGRSSLLQHFGGWEIETARPRFDPGVFTLMDFDVAQRGATAFRYVLPLSPRRALVEHTVFSAHRLSRAHYDARVREWLDEHVAGDWVVRRREYGAIPMTDAEFPQRSGASVFNIGTVGGMTKPTTGYTFTRIQAQARHLATTLAAGGRPEPLPPGPARFRLYDSLLLDILQERPTLGRPIFERLFRGHRVDPILSFLGEQSRPLQEMRIFASLPIAPFLRALARYPRRPRLALKAASA